MSQDPTEKEISTAREKLVITNDLEKTRESTKTSLFKPMILRTIDWIKEKKKLPDIHSIYDYLSKMNAFNIEKVSIELILNDLIKENVLLNKKTSLGDSFRQINTPPNLVNSLHTDLCPNNELVITVS